MHLRAIDYDAIRAQRASRKVMSATTNGERTPVRTRPTNGVRHILRMRTASDRCWVGLNRPIPELAHLLIGCVLGEDEIAGEERREILENGTSVAQCGCHGFSCSCLVMRGAG